MKKLLIISYYWPPSGGAGVQRWLKLSKYLVELNIEVHVLTVDPAYASYMSIDDSLAKDIHPDVKVHTTQSFEIINHYAKLVGKNKVPTAGFSNVDNKKLSQQLITGIRSNFFIPDPRIGWKKYAVKKAIELINEYDISTIVTTSPPHSTQIIGKSIKKRTNVKWLVDFRDPWTDIYYYRLLNHSFISKNIDKKLEKAVIEECDQIITVSEGFRSLFLTKSKKVDKSKFEIIPNGFDAVDFKKVQNSLQETADKFTVCYTGTMSAQYDPFVIFDALNQLADQATALPLKLQLVGSVAREIKEALASAKFEVEHIPTVPHSEINAYQKNSDLLLLVIPNIQLANGITPGKLFEYLATENKVLALGPTDSDVNRIINRCNSGNTFERNQLNEIVAFIAERIQHKAQSTEPPINTLVLKEYSRAEQAKKIARLI